MRAILLDMKCMSIAVKYKLGKVPVSERDYLSGSRQPPKKWEKEEE